MPISRNIAELVIRLKDELSGNSENARKRIVSLDKSIIAATRAAAGFAAGASVVGATLFAVAKSAANYAAEMGDAAQRTGIGVETLSGLRHAAELSDLSFEELENALSRFTDKIGQTARGAGDAKKGFDALKISVKNQDGTLRNSEEILGDIAERFAKMPDSTAKTALAIDIFGRAGARLIPLLNKGRSGIAELTEEARKLGIVIDEKTAKAASEFNDNIKRLTSTLNGLKLALGAPLIALFDALAQKLLEISQTPGFKAFIEFTKVLSGNLQAAVTARVGQIQGQIKAFESTLRQSRPTITQAEIDAILDQNPNVRALRAELALLKAGIDKGGARPATPKAAPPLIPQDSDKAAKELAERTKKAVGDSLDFLEEEDKAYGEALRKNEEERYQHAIEHNERMKQLVLEQLYGPLEAADELFSDKMREGIEEREKAMRDSINRIWTEYYTREGEKFRERSQQIEEMVGRQFDAISSGLSRTIEGVILGTQTMEEAFKNLFRNIALSAMDELAKLLLFEPLRKTIVPGIAGFIKGFIPGFQTGGTVPGPIGKPQLAVVHGGEEVIPNGRSGGRTVVNQYFDMRGAGSVTQDMRREIRFAMKQTKLQAVAEVRERRLRGGNYGRAFDR